MSLRRIDARFLLPFIPQRAAVVAGTEDWREWLPKAGVALDTPDPELVVGDGEPAATGRPKALLVEAGRPRAPRDYDVRRFAALPSLEDQSLLVPLDRSNVAAYALETWLFPATRPRALAKRVLVALPRLGLALRRSPKVTIALREPGRPALVAAAAARCGVDDDADWFVVCGQGDELSRGVFVLFPAGARRPAWALKFARVPGYREPFDRDEAALTLAATAGGAAAARAPRLLGRFEVAGYEASVETAAVGSRLSGVLRATRSRGDRLRLVEAVADWLVEVALETRGARGSASDEAQRLRRDVVPAWPGIDASLLNGIDELPGVLTHNDLGGWNVVVEDRDRFTAVDWESARAGGLPLWDLWYFLASVLPQVDRTKSDPRTAFVELFRGDAPSSGLLFERTRALADVLSIPDAAVGRLTTLCWLHHGLSHSAREEALARHAPAAPAMTWAASQYAQAWLADPDLGPTWSRWLTSQG